MINFLFILTLSYCTCNIGVSATILGRSVYPSGFNIICLMICVLCLFRFSPVSELAPVGTQVGTIFAAAINQTIFYSIVAGNELGMGSLCQCISPHSAVYMFLYTPWQTYSPKVWHNICVLNALVPFLFIFPHKANLSCKRRTDWCWNRLSDNKNKRQQIKSVLTDYLIIMWPIWFKNTVSIFGSNVTVIVSSTALFVPSLSKSRRDSFAMYFQL